MKKERIVVRLITYFIGLFIMTAGIAISVKSNLGVSPVSSIPYTVTCVWGKEMGNATILFHTFLVLIQILLLRKKFKWINLLQIPAGIVFGKLTTLSNMLMAYLPDTDNMVIRIIMAFFSAAIIALGIFLYMPCDIMPLAAEGVIGAISNFTGKDFSKVKVGFDISVVAISLTVCLISIHSVGSVGIGTMIAAVMVGSFHSLISKAAGKKRDSLLGINKEVTK